MTIQLPQTYRELVARKVADGTFDSEEDVLIAALELLAEQENRERAEFERLRRMVAEGDADIDAGRYSEVSADDIKRRARERFLS